MTRVTFIVEKLDRETNTWHSIWIAGRHPDEKKDREEMESIYQKRQRENPNSMYRMVKSTIIDEVIETGVHMFPTECTQSKTI